MAKPPETTSTASSLVRSSRSRAVDAFGSPSVQARSAGLAGLLLGSEFSTANDVILHADPNLSKAIALYGFGTKVCVTSPTNLVVGQVPVIVRGSDRLDDAAVSAHPIALFKVVEIQPPHLRKIYGEGPDNIWLVSNDPTPKPLSPPRHSSTSGTSHQPPICAGPTAVLSNWPAPLPSH